jgi:hypothetical protein
MPAVSANGRFVVFNSAATNLVAEDTDPAVDLYVKDLGTPGISLVSVTSAGAKGDADSLNATISADGRWVSFQSYATNLVKGDTNGFADVFVRDRLVNKNLQADLQIVVTAAQGSVQKAALAHYTYIVTNNGPNSADQVNVIDVSSRPVVGWATSQGSCSKSSVTVCRLGTLASGASATIDLDIKAIGMNPLTQKLTVYARPLDSNPVNNDATVATTVTP